MIALCPGFRGGRSGVNPRDPGHYFDPARRDQVEGSRRPEDMAPISGLGPSLQAHPGAFDQSEQCLHYALGCAGAAQASTRVTQVTT